MATIPKEIQDGIKQLSEKKEIPTKVLVDRLKEIMEEDESIQAMEKTDFKIRVAWAALYKEYVSSGGQLCHFVPLMYTSPRSIRIEDQNRLVSEVTALVRTIERKGESEEYGEWEYGAGTFWRDAAKNTESLEKGKVYETEIILADKDRKTKVAFGKVLISNTAVFNKKDNIKAPEFQKYFEDTLAQKVATITLDDLDLNESSTVTDTKVAEVTILDSGVGEKDGTEYAFFEIMDNSITGESKRVFCDPRNLEYIQGSLVLMGLNIRNIAKKDEDTPSMRMNFQWILPTDMAERVSDNIKSKSDDSEDISLDVDTEKEGKGGKEEIDIDVGEKGEKKEGDVFEL